MKNKELEIRAVDSCYSQLFYNHLEHCFQEKQHRVRFLPASSHNIFVNWSIHITLFSVFLFKDTLFCILCWFGNIELGSTTMQVWSNSHVLSVRHVTAISPLEIWDSTATLCVEAIVNSKITTKSTKMGKKMALSRLQKGCCVQRELWAGRQKTPSSISAGDCRAGILYVSAKDQESILSVDLGAINAICG